MPDLDSAKSKLADLRDRAVTLRANLTHAQKARQKAKAKLAELGFDKPSDASKWLKKTEAALQEQLAQLESELLRIEGVFDDIERIADQDS
jgi:DNA repair exonuclease SbcCD ATPase subunit